MNEEIMTADRERESLCKRPERRWITNTETYLNGRTEGGCGLEYFLHLFEGNVLRYAWLLIHRYNYVGT